ncbi:cytochrome c oxidase subunit II [Mucilaginibacter segetis]|uniref:Cytochrome c oxidase subunit 2 n=1 Tax=Mucilaginibacter segetis TaxID=2793071 RepID=A0A934PUA1_9SPHI|nr:cytochrome c oxidase subunit II [Mucilaginibacter segetis]MBK0379692.1 cytochrome c oxidase subunit II [Mucilaginibacter segetis]
MNNFSVLLSRFTDPTVLNTASPQAEQIRSIGNGFLIAATGIFLLVLVLTIVIVVRFRSKTTGGEPRQIAGNRKLEILMVGVPMLLVIVFFFWSLHTMSAIMPPVSDHPADVVITGHQWWWQADYKGTKAVTANEIHLPVGKPLLLQLNSADVIHDWWVPAFGAKMDMIPGTNNNLWVTVKRPGIYEGTCSEFCGKQHAWMRIRVIAQTPDEYHKWLITQSTDAVKPADSVALAGEVLFGKASCSSCHSIRGSDANGSEGPDLTHFASRQTMLSGMMANTPANVKRWLTDPQKVKPGAHMPRFIFNKDSLNALTAYLSQLK